eukprot:SAG11_NODE_15058_length_590_cov_1.281059_1_plen_109_part_01
MQLYWAAPDSTPSLRGAAAAAAPVDPYRLQEKFVAEADPDKVVWLIGRAGAQDTYRDNVCDWDRWKIVLRVLTGVEATDLSVDFELGGRTFHWDAPVAIAPIGVQGGLS